MKRNFVIIFTILILFSFLSVFKFNQNDENNEHDIYRNMINSDFKTTLDIDNSSLKSAYSILSRDSCYMVCFTLKPEYTNELIASNLMRSDVVDQWIQQYVSPFTDDIEGVVEMLNDSKAPNCYIAINAESDHKFSRDFSVLLLNADKHVLYWFYCTT